MSGSDTPIRLMILAGEVSGDMHAAGLLRELRAAVAPRRVEAFGIGGDQLRADDVELFAHTDDTGVVGFWEVLKRARFFSRLLKTMTRLLDERRPDLVLGVDYPGFNLRLEARSKKRGIPTAHYICPQVWAWHKERIPKIARTLDLLVTLFPFEPKLFDGTGLKAVFAGNPLVDQTAAARRAFLDDTRHRTPDSRHRTPDSGLRTPDSGLPWAPGCRRVALFPGSRPNEVRRLLPDILAAAKLAEAKAGPCSFLIPTPTDGVRALVEAELAKLPDKPERLAVVRGESRQALLSAEAAVVKSGTSTLEASLLLCPQAVVYRVSELTYWILKHLVTGVKHISLVNILAGREVCREFIQHGLSPESLSGELVRLLDDRPYRDAMLAGMKSVDESLGPEGASRRAAEAIAGLIA